MDPEKLYDHAFAILGRGNEAVKAGHGATAVTLYEQGIQGLINTLTSDKNPARKQVMEAKCRDYLEALERLKGGGRGSSSSSGGGGGSSSGGGGGGGGGRRIASISASVADLVTRCSVPWDAIAGLCSVKATLREVVIAPLAFPSWFAGDCPDERPWTGILLYGPPGTGKSLLAKAVCTELGLQVSKRFPGAEAAFFSVKVADVLKPYLGQSEQRVAEIWAEARKVVPCVIFLDEILTEMDGVGKNNKGLLVLAATNTPRSLDGALLRRFQKRVYIPLPDRAARARLLEISLGPQVNSATGRQRHLLTPADCAALAERLEGFSGSDVDTLVLSAFALPRAELAAARYYVPHSQGRGALRYFPVGAAGAAPACADLGCPAGCSAGGDGGGGGGGWGSWGGSGKRKCAAKCPLRAGKGGGGGGAAPAVEQGQPFSAPLCPACGVVWVPDMYAMADEALGKLPVTRAHLEAAAQAARSSVRAADLRQYDEFTASCGSRA